jgi:hypothetical protein
MSLCFFRETLCIINVLPHSLEALISEYARNSDRYWIWQIIQQPHVLDYTLENNFGSGSLVNAELRMELLDSNYNRIPWPDEPRDSAKLKYGVGTFRESRLWHGWPGFVSFDELEKMIMKRTDVKLGPLLWGQRIIDILKTKLSYAILEGL